MYSKSIQKLIDIFSKFPTVGPRVASRFVFYLLGLKKEEVDELIFSISDLKKNVRVCSLCFNPFELAPVKNTEAKNNLCQICSNPVRDKSLLCVVEKETDLVAIEKTKKYTGRYFILGGTVLTLKKPKETQKLRIKELEERVKNSPEIKEIILALNPTTEGEATTLYLERIIKPLGRKISRLGRGLPVGGELEYADEETLKESLERRN